MNLTLRQKNQQITNKLIAFVMMLKLGLLILTWVVSAIFKSDYFITIFKSLLLPFYSVMVLCCWFSRKKDYAPEYVKYHMMGLLILSTTLSYLLFSSFMAIFLVVPTFISTRSLDKRETFFAAFFSWLGFLAATFANVILHDTSPVFFAIHMKQNLFIWESLYDVMIFYIVPITFGFIMTTIVAENIVDNGNKLIQGESEQAAKVAVINSELSTAAQIQENSLPPKHYETPDGGISINAAQKPAKVVGGDFYSYILLDKNHLGFLVADVSDKGIPAAMFMMSSMKAIKMAFESDLPMDEGMKLINKVICKDNPTYMFLTLWLGVINLETGEVHYSNAGHPYPLVKHADGTVETLENEPNPLIGCFPNATYPMETFNMNEGDSILLFTDGITDIRNSNDEMLGLEKIKKIYRRKNASPKVILNECETYAGKVPQFDDMTALELSFNHGR